MNTTIIGLELNTGGTSVKVPTSVTSAPAGGTTALVLSASQPKGTPVKHMITSDAPCFVRKGTGTVTALADGTDQYMAANTPYRVELMEGEKLAFINPTGTGNVYITPGA